MGPDTFKRASAWPWLWLSVAVVCVDQLVKYWIVAHFSYDRVVALLPFLNIRLIYNMGAAFSFLGSAGGWQFYFLSGLSVLAVVIMLIWMRSVTRRDYLLAIGFSLVIGGALGNLIDRIHLRYVIDFLDFHIGNWHFATFNVADSAITIGALLLAAHFISDETH